MVEQDNRIDPERTNTSWMKDNTTSLKGLEYAQAKLIPMVDEFVKSHAEGKKITSEEVEKFYNKVLDKFVDDKLINKDEVEKFKKIEDGKSGFTEEVKKTAESLSSGLDSNLGKGEKLMFKLGKFCEKIGFKGVANACMKCIKQENLEKLVKAEKILAQAIFITSRIGSTKTHEKQTKSDALMHGEGIKKVVNQRGAGYTR